jgi:7-cyano-7-deazaguanine synthase in queuosine biosynthesis
VVHRATVVFADEALGEEDALRLRPGTNFFTGETQFRSRYGEPTSLETDVLTVISAIFACDLAFKRGERSNFQRQIHLTVPVNNRLVFQNVADDLRFALARVSNDAWSLDFVQREGAPEHGRMWLQDREGKVLLFSGGLDSIAAAIMYGESKEQVYLASHFTNNQVVKGAQRSAYGYLQERFPGQFSYLPFRVSGIDKARDGFPFPKDREETQRTRSVLFLTLAALVARREGISDVVVIAENGQMAIHLPLSSARIGAFSTHTAHPEFVSIMGDVLSTLLDHPIRIENPFLYRTKAEVVATTVERHQPVIAGTVSCWKAARVSGEEKHCGYCIPCLSRRIALETHGLELSEYKRDILREQVSSLTPDDEGKRNLVELIEFVSVFGEPRPQAELEIMYPELFNEEIDASLAIEMYRRFAGESRDVFNRYPLVKAIVS